ncbi:MAG: gfo/Idh/MocA family oxidoreductase [Verrucomicrobia bacterium]|nr:MAG: gfo/Idh/MocA family oxidoreductase [Verrucomicrobiota bacterium]
MSSSINVGVIGCGYWGPNLVRNFKALASCRLKAICDVNESRLRHLRTLYSDMDAHTDAATLINDRDVHALAIATPVAYHYNLAKASLLAGKHTLVEKPLAASSAECEELIEIADEKGVVLMSGHTFLYSSSVRKICDIINAGDIGDLRYINSRRLNLGLFQKDINVVWDLAPHDISIILHIVGELPLTVNCQGNAHVTSGVEDVTNLSLSFRNKKFATIQSSWLEPRKVREMTIVGTPHYDTFAEFHYSYHYGDSYIPHIQQEEPLKVECQHFIDCIESGMEPTTSGRSGLELVTILEAATASLKANGAPVNFLRKRDDGIVPPRSKQGRGALQVGPLAV